MLQEECDFRAAICVHCAREGSRARTIRTGVGIPFAGPLKHISYGSKTLFHTLICRSMLEPGAPTLPRRDSTRGTCLSAQ